MHSKAAGASATRGGLTQRDGALVSPASSNSSTPGATGAELMFIASRSAQLAIEQVNSPLSSMLRRLSLWPPEENITIGGRSLTALKKL